MVVIGSAHQSGCRNFFPLHALPPASTSIIQTRSRDAAERKSPWPWPWPTGCEAKRSSLPKTCTRAWAGRGRVLVKLV